MFVSAAPVVAAFLAAAVIVIPGVFVVAAAIVAALLCRAGIEAYVRPGQASRRVNTFEKEARLHSQGAGKEEARRMRRSSRGAGNVGKAMQLRCS